MGQHLCRGAAAAVVSEARGSCMHAQLEESAPGSAAPGCKSAGCLIRPLSLGDHKQQIVSYNPMVHVSVPHLTSQQSGGQKSTAKFHQAVCQMFPRPFFSLPSSTWEWQQYSNCLG